MCDQLVIFTILEVRMFTVKMFQGKEHMVDDGNQNNGKLHCTEEPQLSTSWKSNYIRRNAQCRIAPTVMYIHLKKWLVPKLNRDWNRIVWSRCQIFNTQKMASQILLRMQYSPFFVCAIKYFWKCSRNFWYSIKFYLSTTVCII